MISDRQIFYFHEYNGQVKEKNVGFLKWTHTDSDCKMEICIKGLSGNDTVGFYTDKNEYLGEVFLQNGRGELCITGAETSVNGIDFTKIYHICGEQGNGKTITCIIKESAVETGKEVPAEMIVEKPVEKIQEEPATVEQVPDYFETAWDKMCKQYEKTLSTSQ